MSAAPLVAVCVACRRAWVSIGASRRCAFSMGGCGGEVVDLPEPLPNDCRHIQAKYFLRAEFMPHIEGVGGDLMRSEGASAGQLTDDARDAARWRWWCRWWLDVKDDMERINDLEYDDDQALLNAAVDAEIAKDGAHVAPQVSATRPDEYMCPNCVTPWKCNGPHIPDQSRA